MIVLGLDPGTVRTGFAVVKIIEKNKFSLLNFGVLCVKACSPLEQRLLEIGRGLEKIYQQYSVSETAIEQVFFGKNPSSAFKLGQVFGLCVYQAQRAGSSVFPYAARYIKKAVTGSGRADKKAVQIYVCNIFGIKQDTAVSSSAVAPDVLAVASAPDALADATDVPSAVSTASAPDATDAPSAVSTADAPDALADAPSVVSTADATDALAVALCHVYQKQSPNLQSLSSSVPIDVKAGR